jgi:23S rRNA (cytosine1962-C5)-methyltransferase
LSDPSDPSDLQVAVGFARALVVLKPRKSTPFYARHPWVFDSAVDRIEGECADGDVVDLVSEKRKFIARGILNRRSRLMVRLYTWKSSQGLDDDFWRQRIERAVTLRTQLGFDQPTAAARLVYSEADGLSGLVVDRYAGHLVMQVNALAVALRADRLVELLADQLAPDSITLRCDAGIAKAEGIVLGGRTPPAFGAEHNSAAQRDTEEMELAPLPGGDHGGEPGADLGPVPPASPPLAEGLRWGRQPSGLVFIEEHGLRYGVDLLAGQKTGFYLDQRENRLATARYLGGRQVLDLFCYSGAFSLTASRLGAAREVLGIDTSDRAVTLARANAELNGVTNVRFEQGDGFQALDEFLSAGRRFEAVVLDPPKFTRSRQSVDDALRAYHRLNRVAADLLEPGGILVTCSCSGSVSREDFLQMLAVVAQKCGRDIQVLEQRGASPDHPVSATCPESEYLKCFICRVG